MPKRVKLPPLVVVRWRDAFMRSQCATLADALKDDEHSIRHTTGWLIEDGPKVMRVAMTYDAGDVPEYDDRYTIPRAYVEDVRYVTRRPRVAEASKKEKRDAREAEPEGTSAG